MALDFTALELTYTDGPGDEICSNLNTGVPYDSIFNDDGTVIYVSNSSNNIISEFALTTPYDISTATFVQEITLASAGTVGKMTFKVDGTVLYVIERAMSVDNVIYSYTLSTPYDISTSVASTSKSLTTDRMVAIQFKTDGLMAYVSDRDDYTIWEYSMSTAWDISTMVATGNDFPFFSADSHYYSYDFFIEPDGLTVRVLFDDGTGSDTSTCIVCYDLSIAWDLTTAVINLSQQFGLGVSLDNDPYSMDITADLSKVIICGYSNSSIFSLSFLYYTSYTGTVLENGLPVSRQVRLHLRSTGEPIQTVTSDGVTGSFTFTDVLIVGEEYYIVVLDNITVGEDFNAFVFDKIIGV